VNGTLDGSIYGSITGGDEFPPVIFTIPLDILLIYAKMKTAGRISAQALTALMQTRWVIAPLPKTLPGTSRCRTPRGAGEVFPEI
jgi:hypothetical protein